MRVEAAEGAKFKASFTPNHCAGDLQRDIIPLDVYDTTWRVCVRSRHAKQFDGF